MRSLVILVTLLLTSVPALAQVGPVAPGNIVVFPIIPTGMNFAVGGFGIGPMTTLVEPVDPTYLLLVGGGSNILLVGGGKLKCVGSC